MAYLFWTFSFFNFENNMQNDANHANHHAKRVDDGNGLLFNEHSQRDCDDFFENASYTQSQA